MVDGVAFAALSTNASLLSTPSRNSVASPAYIKGVLGMVQMSGNGRFVAEKGRKASLLWVPSSMSMSFDGSGKLHVSGSA